MRCLSRPLHRKPWPLQRRSDPKTGRLGLLQLLAQRFGLLELHAQHLDDAPAGQRQLDARRRALCFLAAARDCLEQRCPQGVAFRLIQDGLVRLPCSERENFLVGFGQGSKMSRKTSPRCFNTSSGSLCKFVSAFTVATPPHISLARRLASSIAGLGRLDFSRST